MKNVAWERDYPWAKRGWRFLGLALVVVLLAVLGQLLHSRWQELPAQVLAPNWSRLAGAVLMLLGSSAMSALQWRRIVIVLGHKLSVIEAIYIHFFVQAGKYLPGRVMLVVGKVMLAARQGLPVQGATASVIYEQVLFLMSGAWSVLLFTSLASADVIGRHRPIILAVFLAGFALLHPAVIRQIFRAVRWVSQSEIVVPALSYRATLGLLVGYCVPWLISGGAFYLFVTALAPLGLRLLPDMAAVVGLAGVLGLVSVFAPAGLGVREAVLTALLSVYFSLPVGVAIALAFRLATTLVDGIALLCAIGLQPQCHRLARVADRGDEHTS